MISLVALVALSSPALANGPQPQKQQAQFVSALQLAVRENSPEMMERSKKMIIDRFSNEFEATPAFQNHHYELRRNGNELIFVMTSHDDMRKSVQKMVADMIHQLNGRVQAHGRSMFYRTALSENGPRGYLEVVTDSSRTKVMSIAAQSVPLRDLLKELRMQMGGFSYLVPGECAERLVDFSFSDGVDANGKDIDTVMTELATVFGLKSEKRNSTFIFTGVCEALRVDTSRPAASELIRNTMIPDPSHHLARPIQVYLPLMPISD